MNCKEVISSKIDYSIEELNQIVQTYEFSKIDNSYGGKYLYKITTDKEIPGETFRKYEKYNLSKYGFRKFLETEKAKEYIIEVSNLARIRINGKVKEQYQNGFGYLYVSINENIKYLVYRFVAETWVTCPVENTFNYENRNYWTVHHITNNGFDNRPQNLIWMPFSEHKKINHMANVKNETIRKKILQELIDACNTKVEADKIIEYLEDIHSFSIRPNKELIHKIIDLYNIDPTSYKNINW